MKYEIPINENIISKTRLYGGDIGNSYKLITKNNTYFVKEYAIKNISRSEAIGLSELNKCKKVFTPKVINYTDHVLVLEYIKEGIKKNNFQTELGEMIASLHMITNNKYGYIENNFIGRNIQLNKQMDNWVSFFIKNRLDYQVNLAKKNGYSEIYKLYLDLKPKIYNILEFQVEKPSLLHGDLWSGNIISSNNGHPILIDPAVYYGNREMELSITKLFGGFTTDFYSAYNNVYPLKEKWQERINIYMLYHILNHLNLFGPMYLNQVKDIIFSYL